MRSIYLVPKGAISYRQEGEGWVIQLQNTCDEIYSPEQWDQGINVRKLSTLERTKFDSKQRLQNKSVPMIYIERHSAKHKNGRIVGNDAIKDESYSEVCILCSNTSILAEFT